jgi:CDP-glucose 4,6-dehydratase
MPLNRAFWLGRRVLVTGHTGFRGTWLLLLLESLGADITGFALPPPTDPAMFDRVGGAARCRHILGDVRDLAALDSALAEARPDIVFHLAGQPVARAAPAPVDAYAVNLQGTVHLLDACRRSPHVAAIVLATTDKCYRNDGRRTPYAEDAALGGNDPESNSRACAELAAAAFRDRYFQEAGVGLATARAGSVIGGGDHAADRLVPDAMRTFAAGRALTLRNPSAIRPWQHALDPLSGYVLLAERLRADPSLAQGWNFGASDTDSAPVASIADRLARLWGARVAWKQQPGDHAAEPAALRLDSTARAHPPRLGAAANPRSGARPHRRMVPRRT